MHMVELPITRLLRALASAVLLAASLLHPNLWPLAGVALVPWLVATHRAGRLESLGLGALTGTAFGCLVVAWIPEALRALGSSNATALGGLLLTAAWAKAALFAATGLLARELNRAPHWAAIGLVGGFFGCGEAWISASSWGVPGALLGHSQIPALGVAQLAVVGGVPLVSAWLVSLNMAIALGFLGARGAWRLAAGLAAGWFALAGFGLRTAEFLRAILSIRPRPCS
jgi:apolipoprotein N-acyltransferase